MTFSVTHRDGDMEHEPPIAALDALVAEFDRVDSEHPDVSVKHESEWALSAFPSGLLIFENVEAAEPRHRLVRDRDELRALFAALAVGDLATVEAAGWASGPAHEVPAKSGSIRPYVRIPATMAESSTRLLREGNDPLYVGLRALLADRRIDVSTCVLAAFFPDDTNMEFGVVVTLNGGSSSSASTTGRVT
jgi:hypothetical protein